MARYALIKNGVVKNVIIAESEIIDKLNVDADKIVEVKDADIHIGAKDFYDGQKFVKLPDIEPQTKTKTLEERLAEIESEISEIKLLKGDT